MKSNMYLSTDSIPIKTLFPRCLLTDNDKLISLELTENTSCNVFGALKS